MTAVREDGASHVSIIQSEVVQDALKSLCCLTAEGRFCSTFVFCLGGGTGSDGAQEVQTRLKTQIDR